MAGNREGASGDVASVLAGLADQLEEASRILRDLTRSYKQDDGEATERPGAQA